MILQLLRNFSSNDLVEKIRANGLAIIALYKEAANPILLQTQINNFKTTLNRNKPIISQFQLESYFNLIKVIEWLMCCDDRKGSLDLAEITILIYRNWYASELENTTSSAIKT